MSERCRSRCHANQGFSLIELLVATLIFMVVTAAIFAMIHPAQGVFQVQPEFADVQQRVRVGIETMRKDLAIAGAGIYGASGSGPLGDVIAPVMPYRAFGSTADPMQGVHFRTDAVSVLFVPTTASQTTTLQPVPAQSSLLSVAASPNCPPPSANQICGFGAGDDLLVLDNTSNWDLFTVVDALAGVVQVAPVGPTFTVPYGIDAIVTEVRAVGYYLKPDPATSAFQLMLHEGRADMPVVDHVVRLTIELLGDAEPPQLTGRPLTQPGPWTTYGPAPPPANVTRGTWPPGENCAFALANGLPVPRLATFGASGVAIPLTAAMLTDGPWCPDAVKPNRFDADLLRVRRVRVTLRVQAAVASLRGPAGALFLRGGTAKAGDAFVPDQEVQFEVVARNMSREM